MSGSVLLLTLIAKLFCLSDFTLSHGTTKPLM
ncbi:hypothetical protein Pla52o_37260 [Novipirellula galeiformis]|uniref:Uncharacterized protein n=1 Tax=Novipirellula galeiformis TaxID=2528004 RepID=A0A5C6CFL5_9BACT|nr:hypothetical protein Pla52o_37260 [Novipirellula galeiformis]